MIKLAKTTKNNNYKITIMALSIVAKLLIFNVRGGPDC